MNDIQADKRPPPVWVTALKWILILFLVSAGGAEALRLLGGGK